MIIEGLFMKNLGLNDCKLVVLFFNSILTLFKYTLCNFAVQRDMRTLIKNIISVALGIAVLASVSGINIYSHSCVESGYEKSSLFAGLADCDHQKKEANTCETSSHDCCSEMNNSEVQTKNTDCCNTTEQQFKLMIEFELVKQNESIPNIFDFVFEELIVFSEEDLTYDIAFSKTESVFKPPAAKTLLLMLHQLKIEPKPYC